jgi:hypothetical protein
MTPTPEPAGDIKAQLAAVLDPNHPKRACFVVPEDAVHAPYGQIMSAARPEGTLVTRDVDLLRVFRRAPEDPDGFDRAMAEILGYPEAKPDTLRRCEGRPFARGRVVQAQDKDGCVITEACCSPLMLQPTQEALKPHVPEGGQLVVLTPLEALGRRILLREAGA